MENNYYTVLEVTENATEEEIKKAYRRLSKRYHPDADPDNRESAQKFQETAEAYNTLSNSEKRKIYDAERKQTEKSRYDGFDHFFGSHPKNGTVDEGRMNMTTNANKNTHMNKNANTNMNKKTKTNPLDTTDLFERYMGVKKEK